MVSTRGFTLLEIMVASGIAAIAVMAAFAFASFQMKSYAEQQDTQQIASSTRILDDTLGVDIRSAGYGTSYWAGVTNAGAFAGRGVVTVAGVPLGVPSIRVVQNALGPVGAPGQGVQLGSDAITILRVEGPSTVLPAAAAGVTSMIDAPGPGPFAVGDLSVLAGCGSPQGSHLVLVSDLVRSGEPASMLVEIDNVAAVAPGTPGVITLLNGAYGINPNLVVTPGIVLPAPRMFGPGSLITCVRLVTYYVDNSGRLRMFSSRNTNAATAGGTVGLQGTWPPGAALPVDPVTDPVIAEGVIDMQVALFMSGQAPNATNGWAFASVGGPVLASEQELSEVRGVRVSMVIASPRDNMGTVGMSAPAVLEDHPMVAANYPATFTYRPVSVTGDLKNMRIYDLIASDTRLWNQVRSYP